MKQLTLISYDVKIKGHKKLRRNRREIVFALKDDYNSSLFTRELTYINFFKILQQESVNISYRKNKKEIEPQEMEFYKLFEEVEDMDKEYYFRFINHSYFYIDNFMDGEKYFQQIKRILHLRYIDLENFILHEHPEQDSSNEKISGYIFSVPFKIKKEEEKDLYYKIKNQYLQKIGKSRAEITRTRKIPEIRQELGDDKESIILWMVKYKSFYFIDPWNLAISIPIEDSPQFFTLNFTINRKNAVSRFLAVSEILYELIGKHPSVSDIS